MDILLAIAKWLSDNIFGQAAILIGLVALVGLLLQGKSFSQVVAGTGKTILGFVIIGAGAGVVVNALFSFGPLWNQVFGITAQKATGMGTAKFIEQFGGTITLIMTFGFLINVLLARFTRFKYIYLTGHMMFWVSFVLVAIFYETLPGMSRTAMVVAGSIIMGVYWTLQPALTQRYMRMITDTDEIALGHTTGVGAFLAGWLGKYVGNPKQSTEDIKVPEWLEFVKDSNISIALVMVLAYVVGALLAGREFVNQASQGKMNHIIWAIMQGVTFAAGVAIILLGVRMLIAEIVPAFRGIATRIVPNAKPALDCPVVYPYAPTAVIVGFLSCFVVVVIAMFIMGVAKWYVLVPAMIPIFFHGGTCGVFGNATGGVRGAILGGIIDGIILSVGQAVVATQLARTVQDFILWGGDTDMFFWGGPLYALLKLFGK